MTLLKCQLKTNVNYIKTMNVRFLGRDHDLSFSLVLDSLMSQDIVTYLQDISNDTFVLFRSYHECLLLFPQVQAVGQYLSATITIVAKSPRP